MKNEIRNILHNTSKKFENELRKNAKKSYDTGALDKSFKSNGYQIKGDKYTIKCEAMFYAKYVNYQTNNQRAKDFIDISIKNVIDDDTDNIIKYQIGEIESLFYSAPTSTNYKARKK